MQFKILIYSSLFLFLPLLSTSQKGFELGAWLGAAHYFGDLNNLYRLNEPGVAGGLIGRYNYNTRVSTRLQLNYMRIRGNDSKSSNAFDLRRNLSFFSDIIEVAPSMEFNFFTLKHGSKDNYITPYMYAGFSVFYFSPKTHYNGELISLRTLGTEGQIPGQEYNEISTSWLIGGGVKMDVSANWSINVDLGYRAARTDFLDDVSGFYPDYTELRANRGDLAVELSDRSIAGTDQSKIGVSGSQRGDSKEKDAFVSFGINLLYYFGRLRCPEISTPRY
ncbi:MAG: outer membrane beta-barrel protein [Saprospiraceae bacterium]|nr:outer membrane beta-barrel protein [Saprospiraceae bacterium]